MTEEQPKGFTLEQLKNSLEEEEFRDKGDTFRAQVAMREGKIVYIQPGFGEEIVARRKAAAKKEQKGE